TPGTSCTSDGGLRPRICNCCSYEAVTRPARSELCVSTIAPPWALTETTSFTPPTCITRPDSGTRTPVGTTTGERSSVLNPVAETLRVYSPGSRPTMTNSPAWTVVTVRSEPVADC